MNLKANVYITETQLQPKNYLELGLKKYFFQEEYLIIEII